MSVRPARAKAHSPGQSEAAPWVWMPRNGNVLKGQKRNIAVNNAFALSGRLTAIKSKPRALPWAMCFWAFSPQKRITTSSSECRCLPPL